MSGEPNTFAVLKVLQQVAEAIRVSVSHLSADDRSRRGDRHEDQFMLDVVADEAAVPLLLRHGFGVHSEESGLHAIDRAIIVVLDPVDGSSNCSRGVPWFGPSLCATDRHGPLAAVVANHGTGVSYSACRGVGAWADGNRITCSGRESLAGAFVHADYSDARLAELAYVRTLGASAHAMCAVADGTLDCYIDVRSRQAPWDYLGATLVVTEAGGVVKAIEGSMSYTLGDLTSCRLAVAASGALLEELIASYAVS